MARLSGKVGELKKDDISFEANSGGGRASLRVGTDNAFIFGFGGLSLEVELPASYGEELELRSGSGEVVVAGEELGEGEHSGRIGGGGPAVELRTGSGEVKLGS